MNLADHIQAAPGTGYDIAGTMSALAHFIAKAERFEMSEDVVQACVSLVDTKPSALNAAMPLCRMPYDNMWIEYRGGINAHNNTRDPLTAPIPERQGFLIRSTGQGCVGFATVVWVHKTLPGLDGVNVNAPFSSPFAIYFDWRPDGDVRETIRAMHKSMLRDFPRNDLERAALAGVIMWLEKIFLSTTPTEEIKRFFMIRHGWKKFANNPVEIEAMRNAENHMLAGLSPFGVKLILEMLVATLENNNPEGAKQIFSNWLGDIQGEGVFMECFLAMLNSRNCIEREPVDFSKLNKARQKRGKRPLLSYTKTKIVLSKTQARTASARGIEREAARLHLVRGHFKIRRTGVYWWCPFTRGDAKRGALKREEYEVK
jgi:hypothetical protein